MLSDMDSSEKNSQKVDAQIWMVLLGIILLFSGIVFFARHVNISRQNAQSRVPVIARYINYAYGVNLRYPSDWKPVGGQTYDRYEGSGGFFSVGASGTGSMTMDKVIVNEVDSPFKPYGTEPYTQTLTIDEQKAKLIMPSPDQDPSMHGQAVLVVEYPEPKVIGTQTYSFLILWADRNNIQDIASSLTFVR